jgi:hypothetical protein
MLSPINSDSCVRRYVEPPVASESSPAPSSTQNSSVSTLSPIEVEIKQQIAAQKADWKKQRESLENDMKKLGDEFDNLYWYEKIYMSPVYGAKALALQAQIWRLSYLENTDTTALEAQLKKSIEDFRADFDKQVVGNADQKIDNPFDPNAPKLNNVFPMVGAKGTSVVGGGGPSLVKTLFNGAVFFFGEWLPLQFQISLYNIMA